MRSVTLFIIAVSFLSSTLATGGPSKWKEVDSRLTKIQKEVERKIMYTKFFAWLDDHEITVEIADELSAQSSNALNILKEAQTLISSKSWTSKSAQELFQKFQRIVIHTMKFIEGTDLPQATQKDLRNLYIESSAFAIKHVREICEILDGTYIFETHDPFDIEPKILKIKEIAVSKAEKIGAIAWLENVKLSLPLDVFVATTRDLMDHAYAMNANRSLTAGHVKEIQGQVNEYLSVAKSNLKQENKLEKLSYTAQVEIRKMISEVSSEISRNFREILQILEGKNPSVVDWTQVLELIGDAQDELYFLVPNIGIAAFKDENGREVHEKLSAVVQSIVFNVINPLKETRLKAATRQLKAKEVDQDFRKFLSELTKIRKETRGLLGKLSSESEKQIRNILTISYNSIEEIGLDITDLLNKEKSSNDVYFDSHDEL